MLCNQLLSDCTSLLLQALLFLLLKLNLHVEHTFHFLSLLFPVLFSFRRNFRIELTVETTWSNSCTLVEFLIMRLCKEVLCNEINNLVWLSSSVVSLMSLFVENFWNYVLGRISNSFLFLNQNFLHKLGLTVFFGNVSKMIPSLFLNLGISLFRIFNRLLNSFAFLCILLSDLN